MIGVEAWTGDAGEVKISKEAGVRRSFSVHEAGKRRCGNVHQLPSNSQSIQHSNCCFHIATLLQVSFHSYLEYPIQNVSLALGTGPSPKVNVFPALDHEGNLSNPSHSLPNSYFMSPPTKFA